MTVRSGENMANKLTITVAVLTSFAVLTYAFTSFQATKRRYDLSQRQIITLQAEALPPGQNTLSSVKSIIGMPEGGLKVLSAQTSKSGITHTRYIHTIDGLRVYRSFIKVASKNDGTIIQIMYRVPKKKMRKRAARLTEKQAIDRAVTKNFGGPKPKAFFSTPPTVEKVYFETHDGVLQLGYDVQNWGVNLYYTLVDGRSGKIIENVLRTSHANSAR